MISFFSLGKKSIKTDKNIENQIQEKKLSFSARWISWVILNLCLYTKT